MFRHTAVGIFSHPDGWKSPWGCCEILSKVFVNWPSGFPQRSSYIVWEIARLAFAKLVLPEKPADEGEMLRSPPVVQRPIITLSHVPALQELIICNSTRHTKGSVSIFRQESLLGASGVDDAFPSLFVPIFLCCYAWKRKKNQITDVAAIHILTESDWTLKEAVLPHREEINTAHTSGTHGGPRIVLL